MSLNKSPNVPRRVQKTQYRTRQPAIGLVPVAARPARRPRDATCTWTTIVDRPDRTVT